MKRLTIFRLNKDAVRSTLFREIVIKYKNSRNQSADDIKESDEEDEGQGDDDEDEIDDYFHDLEFDCRTEILKSKKSALSKKISITQWSGEDVLEDYDPKESKLARGKIQGVRIWRKGILKYWKIL